MKKMAHSPCGIGGGREKGWDLNRFLLHVWKQHGADSEAFVCELILVIHQEQA